MTKDEEYLVVRRSVSDIASWKEAAEASIEGLSRNV